MEEKNLERDGREAERVDGENGACLSFRAHSKRLPELSVTQQIKHRSEERFHRIDIDQDRDQQGPANEAGNAILQSVAAAPKPMTPPENAKHHDAGDKRRNISECSQKCLDVSRYPIRCDHRQSDRKRKGSVNE